ncbi:GNAT family N-acetyltransferase [Loigolactobacillus binensis]|uniref:GNAT family N-acetyltransferase n=1 Tax=Loigolactobacillus binensis TaxID=2559922 RepID=A0ABW3E929_9LACO|nr:GNAT family N-acetyltransferase [Loigolactobacillus binensis]
MEIRWATKADLPQLARIYLLVRQTTFTWVPTPQLADLRRETQGERLLVATIDQQICGFAAFYRPANFVHLLIVAPVWQSHGVGRALLQQLQRKYQQPLQLKCVQGNTAALAFYAHLGFKIVKINTASQPPNVTLQATHML